MIVFCRISREEYEELQSMGRHLKQVDIFFARELCNCYAHNHVILCKWKKPSAKFQFTQTSGG